MRLIDADELKKALSDKDIITWTHEYGDAIPVDWLMSAIDNAPTVEIPVARWNCYCEGQKVGYEKALSERPQGEWIPNGENKYSILFGSNSGRHCSICGKVVEFSENYCPNCGAEMKMQDMTGELPYEQ